ncbi:MAG: N-acetylglucosamine-6-phosphate deacetylase, partial [Clostridia bacterium]
MKTLYKNGLLARNGQLEKADMLVENGKIVKIAPSISADATVVDVHGKTVLPKLFDEHTHGSFGFDFNLANLDEMRKVIDFYKEQKVGTVFPTLLTDTDDVIEKQILIIKELSKEYPEVKGVHLEGPFLSKDYKGAMPE